MKKNVLNPDYSICLCRKMTVRDVAKIIEENKITDLKTLCELAKVGDKCGGCREELEELLELYTLS